VQSIQCWQYVFGDCCKDGHSSPQVQHLASLPSSDVIDPYKTFGVDVTQHSGRPHRWTHCKKSITFHWCADITRH